MTINEEPVFSPLSVSSFQETLRPLAMAGRAAGPGDRILGVTSDSRECAEGIAFVAIRGTAVDGHGFLEGAQARGSRVLIGELPPHSVVLSSSDSIYLQVRDSREALAALAAEGFGHPSRSMKMIGVTGTSGKTTTTFLVEAMLRHAGERVGLIGTVAFRFEGREFPSTHTTPGPLELQKLLRRMRDAGCSAVVMEVSSHALSQKRVHGVDFDAVAFTNLSREHLDFHPDMEDYFRAKALLFGPWLEASRASGKNPGAVINGDDEWGRRLLSDLVRRDWADRAWSWSTAVASLPAGVGRLPLQDIRVSTAGTSARVDGIPIRSGLIGDFNLANLAAAFGIGRILDLPDSEIVAGLESLSAVPGRLERVTDPRNEVTVLVDYAHKPDALEKVLRTLRGLAPGAGGGRLGVVFGCGGDRDRGKRPVMGGIAAQLADRVVVTSDNPRTERPDAIIREVLSGIAPALLGDRVEVEEDRARAIRGAVLQALPGDVWVIAGKGHEDYQIISDAENAGKTCKIPFDDREHAARALAERAARPPAGQRG